MNIQEELKKLHDIYGLRHVPWWQTPFFYAVMVGIAVLLLLFIGLWLYKFFKKRRLHKTPWEKALIQLSLLKNVGAADNGKEFYFSLTEILKNYLHERYHFDVLGKTDEEIGTYLASANFPQELLAPIKSVLSGSVTIKFANAHAARNQMENDLGLAIMIIKKTIPSKK